MKKFVSALVALGMLSTSVVFAEFDDVSGSNIYSNSVEFLETEEVLTGNPDGTLGYYDPINRAELLTIISRAVDVQLDSAQWIAYDSEECFSDVKEGKWYTKHVCYAKDAEWVGGYSDGSFKPNDPVNFVEALKILAKAFDIDYDENSSPWYKDLVEESSDKMFIPLTIGEFGQEITKGEMSDLIGRVLKFKAGELDEWIGEGSEYPITYEMLKNKDSFFLDGVEGIWDEPGEVFKRMVKGFGTSDCGGYKCFDDKFQKCETATMEFTSLFAKTFDVVIGYEIEGSEDGDCYVKTHFVSGYGGEWDGKEMTCKYDNDKGFENASEEIAALGHENRCEGDLLEYFEEVDDDDEDDDDWGWDDDDDDDELDWDEDMKLDLMSYDIGAEDSGGGYYVTITVEDAGLNDGENYFAECVGGESSNDMYPDVLSEDPVMTINDLQGGVEYSCYVQVSIIGTEWEATEHFTVDLTDFGISVGEDEEELEITSFTPAESSIALTVGGRDLEPGQHYNYACIDDGTWLEIPAQVESYGTSTTITNLSQDTSYTCTVSVHNDSHIMVGSPSEPIWTFTLANPDQLGVISTSISSSGVLTIDFEDLGDGYNYSADCTPGILSTFEDSDAYDPPAQSGSSNEFTFMDLTPGGTIYRCYGSTSGKDQSADVYYETYD